MAEAAQPEVIYPMWTPFFGVMGAASAMIFSALGAAYGTAKSGTGISAMAWEISITYLKQFATC